MAGGEAPGRSLSERVVRGGAARVAGFAVVNLLGAAGAAVLARALGVEGLGRYGTVLALVTVLGGITDAGLTVTGSRELALLDDAARRRALLGAMLGARLALAVLAFVLCLGIGRLAGYGDAQLAGLALAAFAAILTAAQATLGLPLVVELRNGAVAAADVARQVALFAGIVVLALLGAGLVPFLALQVLSALVALAATLWLLRPGQATWPRFDLEEWRALARVALPVALALVLTLVYVRVLIVLTSLLADDVETGLFVASSRVVEMLGGLPLLLSGVILPVAAVAARDDRGRLRYVVGRTTELSLLLGLATAIGVGLAAPTALLVLGGADFAAAAEVLRLQAPAIVTVFVLQSWVTFLIAEHRHREVVGAVVLGLVALLVASLALIPPVGARGAAGAAVLADLVYAAALFRAMRAVADLDAPLGLGFALRALGCAAVALGVGVALLPVDDLLAGAVAAAAFTGLVLLARLVPPDLLAALPRLGGSPA
jgi:O-antigen/teichoic acid export membrane protein